MAQAWLTCQRKTAQQRRVTGRSSRADVAGRAGRSAQPPAATHRPRNRTGHNVKKRFASVSAGNVSPDAKPDAWQTSGTPSPDRQRHRQRHTANHGGKCPLWRKLVFVRLPFVHLWGLWSPMGKGANRFSGASRFSAWRGFYGSQRIRESRRPSRQWFGGRLLARIYATP